jgi:hypothetical protein
MNILKVSNILNHFYTKWPGKIIHNTIISKQNVFVLLIIGFSFLFSGTLFANTGWYIVEKSEDRFGNSSFQSTFIQNGLIRIENAQSIFILDLRLEKITLVFPQKMSFWSGNHDTLRLAFISAAEVQLRTTIAQLPEQEREAAQNEFEKIMSAMKSDSVFHQLPNQISISKNQQDLSLLGYHSTGYDIKIDTVIYEKVWFTDSVKPYSTEDIRQIARMTKIFTKPSVVSFYRASEEWFNLMQNGFIMKSIVPTDIGESITLVDSMKEIEIPTVLFEPPADYRQIGIDELIQITMGDEKPEVKSNTTPKQQQSIQELYSLPEQK